MDDLDCFHAHIETNCLLILVMSALFIYFHLRIWAFAIHYTHLDSDPDPYILLE